MKPASRSFHIPLILLLVFLLQGCQSEKDQKDEKYAWIGKISKDHPRLFISKASFQAVKDRALNEEYQLLMEIKSRIDEMIGQKIEFSDPLVPDGTQNRDHMYGTRAAESAFLFLVLEDEKYLAFCKEILIHLVDYYTLRNDHNLNIQWYAFSRINALAAYDWIYNELSVEERLEIGKPLLQAIHYMPSPERGSVFRRNTGGIKTGFYGPPCLPWYAGIVFHRTGIDDSLSAALVKRGFDDHIALLSYRSEVSGDDGGAASAVLGYCMGAYPWAEYNFFHTFHSATGLDIAQEWLYVPDFINYIFWNWLPGDRQFGYGDANHRDNDLPSRYLHLHLSQMIHFYGKTRPELISLAKWMRDRFRRQHQEAFPFARFLLTSTFEDIKPEGPSEILPRARHFVNMGQLFMRSGSGPDDTYALFTAGGMLSQHRHFDNNNFIIFKKGFLTLDTGTRPQPGLHLSHYYARTVAHNCITIKMPGEIMPPYWDSGPALSEGEAPESYPNDGGQQNMLGSEIIAFDEQDEYVYLASDASDSYHPDKTLGVFRQFVFLPPDFFVIFDRVISKDPAYHKRWLLHTAAEPMVKPGKFQTDHWGGRLFCRTVYPADAELFKVGGPGKQFWSDGKNWALPELTPEDWNYQNMKWLDNNHDLFGQWRMEVTPGKSKKEDVFLHLLQVGDTTLKTMEPSTPVWTEDLVGLRFGHGERFYELTFSTKERAGGRISITENGQEILNEELSGRVKPQSGLY